MDDDYYSDATPPPPVKHLFNEDMIDMNLYILKWISKGKENEGKYLKSINTLLNCRATLLLLESNFEMELTKISESINHSGIIGLSQVGSGFGQPQPQQRISLLAPAIQQERGQQQPQYQMHDNFSSNANLIQQGQQQPQYRVDGNFSLIPNQVQQVRGQQQERNPQRNPSIGELVAYSVASTKHAV